MRIGFLGSSDICYNSVKYFMNCIEKALKREGVDTLRILEDEITGPLDAIIGINNALPSVKNEEGLFYMDLFNCPVFNILLDPPYWHHGILKSHMNNLFLIVLDQDHADYCKKYYAPLKGVDRAYMLGPAGNLRSYEEKKTDVLFTGTFNYEYLDMELLESKIFEAYGSKEISKKLFKRMIQIRIEHPEMSALQALMFASNLERMEYSDDILKSLMNVMGTYSDLYTTTYYRKKIIKTLVDSGLMLHVAGAGWEKLYSSCPYNLILEGTVDFSQTADLIANSKIVLNVMAWKDGIHDRALTAMQNGSICVTNSNPYIDTHFQNGKNIVVFDFKELDVLPIQIRALLKDSEKAATIANAGYLKVHYDYTWESFVKKYILNKINGSSLD